MTPDNGKPPRLIRTLIVDDEYPARAELRYHLNQHDDVEVMGEAATAREALQLIQALNYDVVFVDIAMPGLSGIELAQWLSSRQGSSPYVIFVTAYDEYALKAFEIRALDYILKPVTSERVAETLNRVRQLLNLAGRSEHNETTRRSGRRAQWVMGIRDETSIPIPVDNVVFVTSEDDQVFVYTLDDRYLTRHTLRELEQFLPEEHFFRCHRGYIVNLRFVREISPFFNGTYTLTVPLGRETTSIPVSRSRVAELKRRFWPDTD